LNTKLSSFGIDPYNEEEFNMGFPGVSRTFIRSEVTIIELDGSHRLLEQGKDFFISLSEGNFSIAVDSGSDNYMLFGNDDEVGQRIRDDSTRDTVYFINSGYFYNVAGSAESGGRFKDKRVQISEEIYEIINSGEFDRIGITNTVSNNEMELYHVIGRIRGKNPANSVVISAHFDHKGSGGAAYFPGAFDNASGTAALLYIAEQLKIISNEQLFDFDIVIAFFNGEEHMYNGRPLGSQFFVPTVKEDYENVWNINIDCIGGSDGETYNVGNSGSSSLCEKFTAFADERGIIVDNDAWAMSDNINFTALGIPTFNFLSNEFIISGIAHTNLDTPNKLYFPQIVRLADMIVEFLTQDEVSSFEADEISKIQIPLPDIPGGDVDTEMFMRFESVFDAVKAGENVSFYNDFYSDFPDEEQHYFSYFEKVESDERLFNIHSFGDYTLRIIDSHTRIFDNPALLYFNTNDSSELGLKIRLVQTDEMDAAGYLGYEVLPILQLPGYSALRHSEAQYFSNFTYTYGDTIFLVTPGNFMVSNRVPFHENEITIVLQTSDTIIEPDSITDLIRNLRFEEFLEKWNSS
jgi:hypothetical protein